METKKQIHKYTEKAFENMDIELIDNMAKDGKHCTCNDCLCCSAKLEQKRRNTNDKI